MRKHTLVLLITTVVLILILAACSQENENDNTAVIKAVNITESEAELLTAAGVHRYFVFDVDVSRIGFDRLSYRVDYYQNGTFVESVSHAAFSDFTPDQPLKRIVWSQVKVDNQSEIWTIGTGSARGARQISYSENLMGMSWGHIDEIKDISAGEEVALAAIVGTEGNGLSSIRFTQDKIGIEMDREYDAAYVFKVSFEEEPVNTPPAEDQVIELTEEDPFAESLKNEYGYNDKERIERILTHYLSRITWSPNDWRVVFTKRDNPVDRIYLWHRGEEKPVQVGDIERLSLASFYWSPNSKYVIADRGTTIYRHLKVISAGQNKVIKETGCVFGAVWSPDSNWIAFTRPSDISPDPVLTELEHSTDLILLNVETGEEKLIAAGTSEHYYTIDEWESSELIKYRKCTFANRNNREELEYQLK